MPLGCPMDWIKPLKDYRRRHGLTQAALAEVLNVDPTTVSRWERGRDQPALGILRRLRSLVMPTTSDVERGLRALIDTSDVIAVLYDSKYRLLYSSSKHRNLLALDASELYGRPFHKLQSQAQAALLDSIGGASGWFKKGIVEMDCTLLRQAFERARNPTAYAQRGTAWTIRDGVEAPLILGITREIPIAEYQPTAPMIATLDDPLKKRVPGSIF